MIQRIQSVYLLITAILMAVTVCSPIMLLGYENVLCPFTSLAIYGKSTDAIYSTWGVAIIACLSGVLAFIDIFLYKNRKLQIKVCNINTLLIIAFYAVVGVYVYVTKTEMNMEIKTIQYGIILPFAALVFNILATIKIKSDEKLVQSLNRIR